MEVIKESIRAYGINENTVRGKMGWRKRMKVVDSPYVGRW